MGKKAVVLLPNLQNILTEMGENIRLARLRRGFSVLNALKLEKDILLVAKDDELGRKLQDLNLPVRMRAPKKR